MEGLSLDARIRRKESLQALKSKGEAAVPRFLGYGQSSHLPSAPAAPPDTNQLLKFKDELLEIDRQKKKHLVVRAPVGGVFGRGFLKLSTVLVVILFALSGALFFAGGYLFSYNNPPASSGLTALSAGSADEQEKADWRVGTVVEGAVAAKEATVPPAYMARREYLERNETLADRVAGDSENRMQLAAQNEAKRVMTKTTNDIKTAVRGVVGQSISQVFNPLAESVVGNTVGAAIEKGIPAKAGPPGTEPGAAALDPTAVSSGIVPNPVDAFGASPVTGEASGKSVSSDGTAIGGTAIEKASGPVPATAATTAPAGPMGDLFALELKSFVDSTEAYTFMTKMKESGYAATYIVRAQAGKNIVYKVRVGNFANYADASQARQSVGYPCRVVLATQQDDPLRYGGGR